MPKMREVCRDREICSPGLSIYMVRIRKAVGDVGAMDEPKRWRKKVKDPDGDYKVDLVETISTCVEVR